jgi:glycosyltransferase involved in cell wall biosynthesis
MHVLISSICRHAANLGKCLAASCEIREVTLLVGIWQLQYFRHSFALDRIPKLRLVGIDISRHTLARNHWYLFGLPEAIAKYAPDVVHLAFPIPFLRKRIFAPVVSTVHDLYPYDAPENLGALRSHFNRWSLRRCVLNSDHVVCVSDATRARMRQVFPSLPESSCSRVYNVVNDVWTTAPVPVAVLANTDYLLAVAQHRRNKNLSLLLRSFARLLRTGALSNSTRLVIVGGDGPETERLRVLFTQLRLTSSVLMMSGLSDSELGWLYRHCTLMVAPSLVEGFNLPLVEALACGCQVVCSHIPIHREIAGECCEYFSPRSPNAVESLTNTIVRAIAQPTTVRFPIERFCERAAAADYVALYRELLATRSHADTLPFVEASR